MTDDKPFECEERILSEEMPQLSVALLPDGTLGSEANIQATRLLGFSRDELLSMSIADSHLVSIGPWHELVYPTFGELATIFYLDCFV